MSLDWLPSLLAGAGGTVIGTVAARRKMGAETEHIAVRTLRSVLKELRVELDRKEAEINTMRDQHQAEIDGMRVKVGKLESDLNIVADMPPGHLG